MDMGCHLQDRLAIVRPCAQGKGSGCLAVPKLLLAARLVRSIQVHLDLRREPGAVLSMDRSTLEVAE